MVYLVIQKNKNEKDKILEEALKLACKTPIQIVKASYEAIKLHEELVEKSSKLVISDIAVGVQFLRSTLISGQINVMININMIKDREYVKKVKSEIEKLVIEGIEIADMVYKKIEDILSE